MILENEPTLLELWKYFQDDAARIKEKMWTIASWLYTLLGGILGFVMKEYSDAADGSLYWKAPGVVAVIAGLGIIAGLFGRYMLWSYGLHIQTSWNRATFIKSQIDGLDDIWKAGVKNDACQQRNSGNTCIPLEAKRLRFIALCFVTVHGIVLLLSLIQLLKW